MPHGSIPTHNKLKENVNTSKYESINNATLYSLQYDQVTISQH